MGISAACKNAGNTEAPSDGPCIFQDLQRGSYADLSSCQVWTRVVHPQIRADCDETYDIQFVHGPVVCAVLWRLLDAPLVPPGDKCIPSGPVLEVLFLATSLQF